MKTIRISIIIATFNAGAYLERCLQSIRSQKTEDVELLIMDGGSSDSTLQIAYNNTDIIDKIVSEKDEGIYDAWNKGIKVAGGNWIMFLGSDDVLLPGALQAYFDYMKNYAPDTFDVISSKLDLVNEKGIHKRFVGERFEHKRFCERKLSFAHPGMLHSKKMLTNFGGFSLKYRICSDADFFIRNGRDLKAGFVDFVTVRMQQGGLSGSYASIIEAYNIRRRNRVIDPVSNLGGAVKLSIMFTLSRIKSKILNK